MRRTLALTLSLLTIACAAGFMTGCLDDPQDPQTWIKKLGDPRDGKQAVTMLVRLKDPAAVQPLIDLFKKSKDADVLKAIATFKDKRQVPVMIDSLDYSEDSFDNAATAANALGETPDPSAVDPLIKALEKPLPVRTRANIVKLESMKSLVKIGDKRAVPALIKVLSTSADDQDFYLNQVAAESLGNFGDPQAVPALVRGLFMTGRGTDIYQPCRVSLLQIGAPAIKPLIEAMEHKNAQLEADGKKYKFRPGIIEQKTALVLGDLRAKEAIPQLLEILKKPKEGDNHTGALYALGMIADPSTFKDIAGVLSDAKRDWHERISAAEGLNLAGATSELDAILKVAKTGDVTKDGQKYPDVRIAAAMAYSRIGGKSAAAPFAKVAATEKAAKDVFDECMQRLEVAKKCGQSLDCYTKELDDPVLAKQEKAAFMLARMGKGALPALTKKISTREPVVRMAVLFGIGKIGDKTATATLQALKQQIDLDKTKPPMRPIVEEMRAVLAEIGSR